LQLLSIVNPPQFWLKEFFINSLHFNDERRNSLVKSVSTDEDGETAVVITRPEGGSLGDEFADGIFAVNHS